MNKQIHFSMVIRSDLTQLTLLAANERLNYVEASAMPSCSEPV